MILRAVTDQDVEIFFGHQAEPEASEMAVFPSRDRSAHFEHWKKIRQQPSTFLCTIESEGVVVGNIVSWVEDGVRELGYWVGREYWGRGIATTALTEFTDIVSDRPLIAHVAEINIGSHRVLSKCGFRKTGLFIDDGDVQLVQYSLDTPRRPA